MDSITPLLDSMAQIQQDCRKLEQENERLRERIRKYEQVVKPDIEYLDDKLKAMARKQDTSVTNTLIRYIEFGIALDSGPYNMIPVDASVYNKLKKLADGRGGGIHLITCSEEVTEYLQEGFDNGRY